MIKTVYLSMEILISIVILYYKNKIIPFLTGIFLSASKTIYEF